MLEALHLYREGFRPSAWLDAPYAMIGIPVIAAETDAEAERLATTPYQRFLSLIRGEPIYTSPPVESMDGIWTAEEKFLVNRKLDAAIVGGTGTVKRKLAALLETTQADEIIFTSDLYHQSDRLRSYEIVAGLMKDETTDGQPIFSRQVPALQGADRP